MITENSNLQANSCERIALSVDGVGKEYRLYDNPKDRIRALLTGKTLHKSHWALRDVSFRLHKGQCMGVIGDNGAGKSTLLKLIVGTMQPTKGQIQRAPRITAILELGAGFHPDFSGRDNLYFGGSLIGISAEEMASLESEIIAFSELGDAIHRPVKTYSSGMVVRLAFALVTAVEPDVLIIDEALAVGDQHFQKKCIERITHFRNNGCTILFCSHSLYHVRQLCNVAIWLSEGTVKSLGNVEDVLTAYDLHSREKNKKADEVNPLPAAGQVAQPPMQLNEGQRAKIESLTIANLGEGEPAQLMSKDLAVTVTALIGNDEQPQMAIMLEQSHGVGITSVATHAEGVVPSHIGAGRWRITLTFTDLPLQSGDYVVSAYLFDSKGLVVYDEWYQYKHFRHFNPSLTPGLIRLPHKWS